MGPKIVLISIEWSEKAPLKRFHLRSSVNREKETSHANIRAKEHFRWRESEILRQKSSWQFKKNRKGIHVAGPVPCRPRGQSWGKRVKSVEA